MSVKLPPSESERFFAYQWWNRLDSVEKHRLSAKYKPEWGYSMVAASTSTIVYIYREENK